MMWQWKEEHSSLKEYVSGTISRHKSELILAVLTACFMQLMLGVPLFLYTPVYITALNILVCLAVIELFAVRKKGALIGSGFLMVFATVDRFVYLFRGMEMSPADIRSIKTGLDVASHYKLVPDPWMIGIWVLFILAVVALYFYKGTQWNPKKPWVLILITVICAMVAPVESYSWRNGGTLYNGLLVNFIEKAKESIPRKPEGYDVSKLRAYADKYEDEEATDYPNIIVIANESFADLGYDSLPNYHALDNAIKGKAKVNIFGGETHKSEYEFLTGNSIRYIPHGFIPFKDIVNGETYSVVSELRSRGYYCIGMHPAAASNWSRDKAYPNLGFNESLFLDTFPQKNLIRGFVSDREVYERVLEESGKHDRSFVYAMTIQNHGDYCTGYTGDIKHKNPDVTEYLSSVHESDKAIKYLIDGVKKSDKKTVVVFFGDHLPRLNEEFYNAYTEEEQHEVPFFIWANYDIEDKEVNTSLCFLQNYMYEAAGFTPKYSAMLHDMENDPGMHKMLTYNNAFDKDKVFKRAF